VKYLVSFCHDRALSAGRFRMDNSCIPTKCHVPVPVVADLMDHFDTISILAAKLGYPLFDKILKPSNKDLLVCKGRKALAKGEYTEDGFVVFAGSISNRIEAASIHEYMITIRKQLIADGVLEVVDNDSLRFTKDYIF